MCWQPFIISDTVEEDTFWDSKGQSSSTQLINLASMRSRRSKQAQEKSHAAMTQIQKVFDSSCVTKEPQQSSHDTYNKLRDSGSNDDDGWEEDWAKAKLNAFMELSSKDIPTRSRYVRKMTPATRAEWVLYSKKGIHPSKTNTQKNQKEIQPQQFVEENAQYLRSSLYSNSTSTQKGQIPSRSSVVWLDACTWYAKIQIGYGCSFL